MTVNEFQKNDIWIIIQIPTTDTLKKNVHLNKSIPVSITDSVIAHMVILI